MDGQSVPGDTKSHQEHTSLPSPHYDGQPLKKILFHGKMVMVMVINVLYIQYSDNVGCLELD